MKIKLHNRHLTILTEIFNTDQEDCAAWVEEILEDIFGVDNSKPEFELLGDNLCPEQAEELTDRMIGHYKSENPDLRPSIQLHICSLIVK